MANRTMYEISLCVQGETLDSKNILITQEEFGASEPNTVIVHPSQVDLLCKWLQEAKKEAESK